MSKRVRPNIKDHTIKKFIGEGGMAEVWYAVNQVDGRHTAVKILHKQHQNDVKIETLFQKEAKAMAKLNHDGIVDYYSYVTATESLEKRPYMLMEYAPGQTVDEYIKNHSGPIPPKTLIPLFCKILDALEHAHNKKIVHRDIKPGNIIISDEFDDEGHRKIKLLDFGIAKDTDQNQKIKTALKTVFGTRMGTVWYMSPEAVRESSRLDKLTDIYSLGVTLFQMATSKIPYEPTLAEFDVQAKIVNEMLPHANTFYPGVSDELNDIIQKATRKKKSDRYQSCAEFKHDLLSIGVAPIIRGNTPLKVKSSNDNFLKEDIAEKIVGLSNNNKVSSQEKKFYINNQKEIDKLADNLKKKKIIEIGQKLFYDPKRKLSDIDNNFYEKNKSEISKIVADKIEEKKALAKKWGQIRKTSGIIALFILLIATALTLAGVTSNVIMGVADDKYEKEEYQDGLKYYHIINKIPILTDNIIKEEAEFQIAKCEIELKGDIGKELLRGIVRRNSFFKGNALIELADYCYSNKDFDEAERYITNYNELPSHRKKVPKNRVLLMEAYVHYANKEYQKAVEIFKSSNVSFLSKNQKMEFFSKYGYACYFLNRHLESTKMYEKYFNLGGNSQWHNYRNGFNYSELKNYKKAIDFYTKAYEHSYNDYDCKKESIKKRGDAKRLNNESKIEYCADYTILKDTYNDSSKWDAYCYVRPKNKVVINERFSDDSYGSYAERTFAGNKTWWSGTINSEYKIKKVNGGILMINISKNNPLYKYDDYDLESEIYMMKGAEIYFFFEKSSNEPVPDEYRYIKLSKGKWAYGNQSSTDYSSTNSLLINEYKYLKVKIKKRGRRYSLYINGNYITAKTLGSSKGRHFGFGMGGVKNSTGFFNYIKITEIN